VDLGVEADLHSREGVAHCFPSLDSPEGAKRFAL